MDDLNEHIEGAEPGQTVTLRLIRDGRTMALKLKLEEMPRSN
jgi:S1-C subfamily serine protease